MAARPIALLVDWPKRAVGETVEQAAISAFDGNLALRAWIRAACGTPPGIQIILPKHIHTGLIDRLEQFGAIVIVRSDARSIPGELRLVALWHESGAARPVLLRPELDPTRRPVRKRRR
jgi:hypothetical protein